MAAPTITAPEAAVPARPRALAAIFVFAAAVALTAALRIPAPLTLIGLACFGILHNVLELRYVTGRFVHVLNKRFLRLLLVLITGIVVSRAFALGLWSQEAEILLGYAVLGVAAVHSLRKRPWLLAAVSTVLAGAALSSMLFPAYHFVVLTHLHNLIPLLFLIEWSRDLPGARPAFLSAQLLWVVVIPALLLAGVFDAVLAVGPAALTTGYTPPVWLGTSAAARFLAVFAFLQTMHYVVWVWFIPRHARAATATFEQRLPHLRGRRTWLVALTAAAVTGALFATDYASGKSLYSCVATYHVYLEFPVVLLLLLGSEQE